VAAEPGYFDTDRARGVLLGGALGDALGMPTQTLSADKILGLYGKITGFVAPSSDHPVSAGLPLASITDDTEQTLLLARLIIGSPDTFDDHAWANLLLEWEEDVRGRGLHDLLGPSTKRALEALLRGVPVDRTGVDGETNGAAMRIAPVGIATPAEPISVFVDYVEQTCRLTHNTATAISGAAAVAAFMSACLDGAVFDQAIAIALAAAREGQARGRCRQSADVADRIEFALSIARPGGNEAVLGRIAEEIGTSSDTRESVPAAFAIAQVCGGNAWQAGLISANLGGDTDTIGAISAGMAGALAGASSLPADELRTLVAVNHLELDDIISGLLAVRRTRSGRPNSLERAG